MCGNHAFLFSRYAEPLFLDPTPRCKDTTDGGVDENEKLFLRPRFLKLSAPIAPGGRLAGTGIARASPNLIAVVERP